MERILTAYVKNLQAIGVQSTIRRIDAAQYERRVKSFDFDVITTRYSLRLTPGVEIRTFWGSEAARTEGSYNLAGISHPAIDALIGKVTEANSREELKTATRALDLNIQGNLAKLSPEDRKAAEEQMFCATATTSRLGYMGVPTK